MYARARTRDGECNVALGVRYGARDEEWTNRTESKPEIEKGGGVGGANGGDGGGQVKVLFLRDPRRR